MIITVRGLKRSEGVIPETKSTYAGWKLFFTYKSLDPDTIGEETNEKFFSDRTLGGIVPNVGDKFEVVVNFEGKIASMNPVIENKAHNYSNNATTK